MNNRDVQEMLERLPEREVLQMEKARRRLIWFIEYIWDVLFSGEGSSFVHNWHIDVICGHLEAVSDGRVRRLLINIPPRHAKSLLVSVIWPAWDWLGNPHRQFLCTSYSETLSFRDSSRMRRIVQSEKYKRLMAYCETVMPGFSAFDIMSDQGEKKYWANTLGGQRISSTVRGTGTGMDSDISIVDDPHNVVKGESVTDRRDTLFWFDESLSSRFNDPKKGALVVIMQRIHELDLSGHILEEGEDGDKAEEAYKIKWDHLCLPGLYEGHNRCDSSLGFVDPRTEENEPLWKGRFDEPELRNMVKGAFGFAGQIQQRPSPRGAGFFEGEWKIINDIGEIGSPVAAWVRYWDKAGSEGQGAYTAGVLMGLCENNCVVVADVVRGQWAKPKRERIIRDVAERDGDEVDTYVEQEPGASGKESSQDTIKNLVGYRVYADRASGSKETRAEPYGIQQLAGNVYVLQRPWTKRFVEEHKTFPVGRYKDIVDSATGAFNKLTAHPVIQGTW
jgi:predicted phage terminase large subunit-like protein